MLTANPNLAKDRDPRRHQTPLFWAAERGRRELVELLIRHGADVNARAPDRSRSTKGDQTGKTPLHVAAEGGHTAVIQTLLEKGANIDATDEVPFTPLHWAIRHERDDAVKLLLEKGATVDLDDTDGGCLRFARENPVITESTPFASASVVTPSHQMAVIGG